MPRNVLSRSMVEIRDRSTRLWGEARVGEPQHFEWLKWILATTIVLNLVDALFTLFWIRTGLGIELNLLMRDLVNERAVLFVGVKIALVSLGALVLWRLRRNPAAIVGIFVSFVIYYFVFLHHLRFASWLVRRLTPS